MQVDQEITKKLILATLTYYDLFDFPLTLEEIEKFLIQPEVLNKGSTFESRSSRSNLEESVEISRLNLGIQKEIEKLVREGLVIEDRGFYTLSKREQIIPVRIRKMQIAQKKLEHARRVAGWMSLVPYIRGVFASGSLALQNTSEDSDLDFFVITKAGRIWTARFLVTGLLSFLGVRRKANQQIAPDKVCLNHYISDDALEIKNQNIFTARIYAHLVPLYLHKTFQHSQECWNVLSKNHTLLSEFKHKNQWVLDYVMSWPTNDEYLVKNNLFLNFAKRLFELIGNSPLGSLFEKFVRNYQKSRIECNPKTHEPNGRIDYTDQVLQFHPDSIEKSILDKYKSRTK